VPSEIHPATWRFLRGIHREGYAPRPELTLTDWLSDRRRAHAALLGEDIQIDRMLAPATLEGLRDRALLSVLL
jgi:hypothetical protein